MEKGTNMNNERTFDFTALDTFQACPSKYKKRMLQHLSPKTVAPALEFGKAIHMGLEQYYLALRKEFPRIQAIGNALSTFKENYTREDDPKRTQLIGEQMLQDYTEVYQKEPFKVIDVEVGFAVPLGGFTFTGRLDALVEWDGQLYVMEHKTTSMLGTTYFKQFEMSMQIDGYIYAAEQLTGRRCLGVLVNAMQPRTKTKKLEDHFARDPIGRTQFEREEFVREVPLLIKDILKSEESGEFVRSKRSCFSYNYQCPYWDLCKYGEDEKMITRDFNVEKWEPYKVEVTE